MDQPRFYRKWMNSGLVSFVVSQKETDILISADKDLTKEADKIINKYRIQVERYIERYPIFKDSLEPLPYDKNAPEIVKSMLNAAISAGVGPMAGIAGAISEFTGKELLRFTGEIILENGGDIFLNTMKDRKIGIYAGKSPLSGKISIKVRAGLSPLGICTSSGTVGHSLSFGKADATVILSQNTILADTCATATCNRVKTEKDIEPALDFAKSIEGITGAMVIYNSKIGIKGDIELIERDR